MSVKSSLPWLDRKGRLSPLRAVVFALLWAPALIYAGRYAPSGLGPRPVHEALRAAGAWTIWWLLVSLTVAPVKAVLGLPGLVVVRRMIGLAALFYGIVHLTLYAADENWRLLHVAAEIVAWLKKCHFQATPEIDRALMAKGFLVLSVILI